MLHKSLAALLVGSTPQFAHHAVAGPVLQPVGVSSPQGDFGGSFALINIINQSGLSAGYISGVTDFAAYAASATHGSPEFGTNSGFTNTGAPPGQFTVDLGAVSSIDGLAFWAVQNIGSVTQLQLFADNDGDFGNGTGPSLGAFNVGQPPDPTPAQVVSFCPTTTRFIHLDVLNMAGGTPLIPGIGELAFRTAPGPSSSPPLCPWDCQDTPNGFVDVADLFTLFGHWFAPGPCDFDCNGWGDILDLFAMFGNWGICA